MQFDYTKRWAYWSLWAGTINGKTFNRQSRTCYHAFFDELKALNNTGNMDIVARIEPIEDNFNLMVLTPKEVMHALKWLHTLFVFKHKLVENPQEKVYHLNISFQNLKSIEVKYLLTIVRMIYEPSAGICYKHALQLHEMGTVGGIPFGKMSMLNLYLLSCTYFLQNYDMGPVRMGISFYTLKEWKKLINKAVSIHGVVLGLNQVPPPDRPCSIPGNRVSDKDIKISKKVLEWYIKYATAIKNHKRVD